MRAIPRRLAGVPIGRGAWIIDIGDDQFTAAASGMTAGLLRVFANGQGSGASRGFVRGDNLVAERPMRRASANDKQIEELRIVLSNGTVKELTVEPPTVLNPERVPLTDAHRRGVVDPMSAALMRVAGNGDPVSPEACRRTIPVFDGRMRFDLQLSFKRMESVQAEKGYQGPVGGLRRAVRAARRLCAGPSGDQVSGGPARHGGLAGADRRDADRGAVPHFDPDPLGTGCPGSHPVRHHADPAAAHRQQPRAEFGLSRPVGADSLIARSAGSFAP